MLFSLLVPVIIVLKCRGKGEVLSLQERSGKEGALFRLFKFATMLKDSPSLATGTLTMRGDARVLPTGKFLRKKKINELPQLLNFFSVM